VKLPNAQRESCSVVVNGPFRSLTQCSRRSASGVACPGAELSVRGKGGAGDLGFFANYRARGRLKQST
jgi:hypothetical protein